MILSELTHFSVTFIFGLVMVVPIYLSLNKFRLALEGESLPVDEDTVTFEQAMLPLIILFSLILSLTAYSCMSHCHDVLH